MAASREQLLKVYDVTLPSGADVTIRLINMVQLLAAPSIPTPIKEEAFKAMEQAQNQKGKIGTQAEQQREMTAERWANFATYAKIAVAKTLVDPQITPDDVELMEDTDAQLLLAFAQRQIDPVDYQLKVTEVGDPLEALSQIGAEMGVVPERPEEAKPVRKRTKAGASR